MSIATTFVPEMARAVARRDRDAFTARTSLGVRLIALLTVAGRRLLFVLRRPIVGAFLQHGEYTPAAADNTSRALAGFALGLVGFSVYLFALRGFYAHQDTRTPFVINVVESVLNIVLAFALVAATASSGSASPSPSPTSSARCGRCRCCRYKVPGFPLRAVLGSLLADARGRRRAGEVMWLVARERRRQRGRRGVAPARRRRRSSASSCTSPSWSRCACPR